MSTHTYTTDELSAFTAKHRSQKNKFFVYEDYIQAFGLSEGCFLSFLINKMDYYNERGQTKNGGWFFCTVDAVTQKLNLSRDVQLRIIKKLTAAGAIQTKVMGVPPKRYFWINAFQIEIDIGNIKSGRGVSPSVAGTVITKTPTKPNCRVSPTIECRVSPTIECRVSPTIHSSSTKSSSTKSLSSNTVSAADAASSRISTTGIESLGVMGESSTPTEYTEYHVQQALKIFQSLRDGNRLRNSGKGVKWKTGWAPHLATLEKHHTQEVISATLDWWCLHASKQLTPPADEEFSPKIQSGTTFVSKFDKVLAFKQRYEKKHRKVEVPEQMNLLVKELKTRIHWPKGTDKFVPEAVAVGHQNYVAFKKAIQVLKGTKDVGLRLMYETVMTHLSSAHNFLLHWMKEVAARLSGWDDYDGSAKFFLSLAFDHRGEKFQAMGQHWQRDITSNPKSILWAKVMECVK